MKNFVTFFVAMMLAMPITSQAFEVVGDQQVTVAQPQSGASASDDAVLAMKGLSRRIGTANTVARNSNVLALRNAKANEKIATSIRKDLVPAIGKGFANTNGKITAEANNLGEQASKNAWLIGGLIGACLLVSIIVGALRHRGTRNAINGTTNLRADELLAAVTEGVAAIRADVATVPELTKTAIRTLDPSPFVFEASGHEVTYQSPSEGIAAGYYLELHVPKDQVGDAATYDRGHQLSRGVAQRNCAKTMRLYFEGKLDAPEYKLQKELIEHLVATGAIKYRKLS